MLEFEVMMPFDGELIIDATNSTFNVSQLIVVNVDEDEDGDGMLTVHHLEGGKSYIFRIGADSGTFGIFHVETSCSSDAPTTNPTDDPTAIPSNEPTNEPTLNRTEVPSTTSSTPSPSHFGQMICGDTMIGDYNDDELEFAVFMQFDGDLVFNATNSEFNISSIVATNIGGDDDNDGVLTLYDLPGDSEYVITLQGVDGSYGTFSVETHCSNTTMAPTSAPTQFCHGAVYQGSMSCDDDGNCDSLWGGDSLVSEDCHTLLVMERSGNLVLYSDGNRRRRSLLSEWSIEWQSNSSLFNYSGESVAEFTMDSTSGALVIWEYFFKNTPSIPPMLIWSMDTNVTADNMQFTLSDSGCFSLSESDSDSNSDDSDWRMCINDGSEDVSTSTMTTTDATDAVEVDTLSVAEDGIGAVWMWVIVGLNALVALCCLVYCGWKQYDERRGWHHSREFNLAEAQLRKARDVEMQNSTVSGMDGLGIPDPEAGITEKRSIPGDGDREARQIEEWLRKTGGSHAE